MLNDQLQLFQVDCIRDLSRSRKMTLRAAILEPLGHWPRLFLSSPLLEVH